jgi:signal transduction histidine kinase
VTGRLAAWLTGRRRSGGEEYPSQGYAATALSVGLAVATAALVWLAYVATREWGRGSELLEQRRATEALALVDAALSRDMKGAWTSLIVPVTQFTIEDDAPFDLLQQTARAFAKFPYPETFVTWRNQPRPHAIAAFIRADRPPPWDDGERSDDPFPVIHVADPPVMIPVIEAIRKRATPLSPFVLLETTIGGVPYQVVGRAMFADASPNNVSGIAAFMVNMDWVRREYFPPLLAQVARIGGTEDSLALAVTDERGTLVASTAPIAGLGTMRRPFPLLFIEPGVIPSHLHAGIVRDWAIHVAPTGASVVGVAARGANRVFAVIAIAAVAALIALLQTARVVRESARLATMKSDLVSAVTHELKTPLATIRLVGDTLARGRYSSRQSVEDYAQLLSKEAARLSQTIDQLLTYAKYTDTPALTASEWAAVDLVDLVDDALEPFQPTLTQQRFKVAIDVSRDLPRVSAELRALTTAIEIVIDNAIKYSTQVFELRITGRALRDHVSLVVADRGIGIHKDELDHVFGRFFRGRNSNVAGSGLGLAIARRIVLAHHGTIQVRSVVDAGTEVEILLPQARY